MTTNRLWQFRIDERFDPLGRFEADDIRRTALLAIEDVLGPATIAEDVDAGPEPAEPVAARLDLPRRVPQPGRAPRPSQRRGRQRPHPLRRRLGIVAFTLGLALLIGGLLGSGVLNSGDRVDARLYEARVGSEETYVVPEVPGHAGAEPSRDRSDSIREFLGMAQAF